MRTSALFARLQLAALCHLPLACAVLCLLPFQSLAQPLQPVSIGPSIFSCRVTDLDVNPLNTNELYVAYASGGLWHSTNNGTTFEPIFDHEASMTIGDIAVDWTNKVLWVGTGECNSSRSSYAGTGLYRSADGGKTWQHRGLPESHHISRVVLHPTDPNTLWVAVLGHLYTPNPERGVYRSTDGGLTWQRTLFVDDNSGAIDLCLDPNNPNTVYAATWTRERRAWNFKGAGAGSAIWKSTDGGVTFQCLTCANSQPAYASPQPVAKNQPTAVPPLPALSSNGFPTGDLVGRIGLTAGLKNGKTVLYASVDNQQPKPPKEEDEASKDDLTKDQLRTISVADFAKLDKEKLAKYLKNNDFPDKYTAEKVQKMVAKGEIKPQALVEYLEDANSALFETDYLGAEVYRSDDDGRSWHKTHADLLEQVNFTYGYYFSVVRCAPTDADQVYLLGYRIIGSSDGGQTWTNLSRDNVHPDHHALWINPANPAHLVNGNDGGLNISWDGGQNWLLCNQPPVGQFYAIATDRANPYNVYGGAQDNGVWVGPSTYEASPEWHQNGQYPYRSLLGGDGMQIQVDPRDNITVYTGYQFGNYFRINRLSGTTTRITPQHDLGERPLRWNWQSPIHLSVHQNDVLYFGANRLYRSFNRGTDWEAISGDLTAGGKPGNVPYGTLTTVHESPLKFGLIYTGSDDGVVQVTRDGGDTWTRLSDSLPQGLWVSRVQASAHVKSRVYVTLNAYRNDDFRALIYTSDDYGQHWAPLGSNLPAEPVNVIREDPDNPQLLYVGTDRGVYYSLDRGQAFQSLSAELPAVPVHDLVVQPTAHDLVIGTHGRSMYRVKVAHLQALTPEVLAEALHVFDIQKKNFARGWGKKQPWRELKDPEVVVDFYTPTSGAATWSIQTKDGLELQSGTLTATAGLNQFKYNLDVRAAALTAYAKSLGDGKKPVELKPADTGKVYLQKGTYKVKVRLGAAEQVRDLVVE